MGDQVIEVHEPLLPPTQGGDGEGKDVEAYVEDFDDTAVKSDEETMDTGNVEKLDDEEEEAEENVECRICHQEDFVKLLEAPCLCSGTLRYAHRSCVQYWCHVKGNIICEICNQDYQPNYTVVIPVNLSAPHNDIDIARASRRLRGVLERFANDDEYNGRCCVYAVGIMLVSYLVLGLLAYVYCKVIAIHH